MRASRCATPRICVTSGDGGAARAVWLRPQVDVVAQRELLELPVRDGTVERSSTLTIDAQPIRREWVCVKTGWVLTDSSWYYHSSTPGAHSR